MSVERARTRVRRAQVRITAVAALVIVVLLLAGAALTTSLYRDELQRRMDESLTRSIEQGVALVRNAPELSPQIAGDANYQVVSADGDVLAAGGQFRDEPPLWTPRQVREPHTVLGEAGELRIVAARLGTSWLVIGVPQRSIDDNVEALRNVLGLTLLPLAAATCAVIWFAVGRSLRPVATAAEHEERLVADVSHELRSPLAGLRLLLEAAAERPGAADEAAAALAQVARLEHISSQLLELSVVEHDPAQRQPVDLDEVVLDDLARRSGAPCEIDASEVVAAQVLGPERELASVVTNLVDNAVRHAGSRVRIRVAERDGWAELVVADDGPGVPEARREEVFDRFARLDDARSRGQGGAGLGLAIVGSIVRAHGGRVWISDTPGGGATFHVRLPATTDAR